jgi:hypothetical protein
MEITIQLPDDAAQLLDKITTRYNVSASDIVRKSLFARYKNECYDNQCFISLFLSKEQSYKLSMIKKHENISVFKYFKTVIEEDFSHIVSNL